MEEAEALLLFLEPPYRSTSEGAMLPRASPTFSGREELVQSG